MMRTILLSCLLLVPLVAGANDKLRIGVVQSTTGIASEDGQTVVQALELAADKLRAGDIEVELLVEDDQTTPKNTVSAYQNLKSKGVDAIIAATWDFTTNTLMSAVGRDEIVLFNTSTLPESIKMGQANGFAFTNAISTYDEAAPFGTFINKNRVESLVIVYANNSWGETQRNVYREIAEQNGLKILGEYSSVSFDQNEWRTLIPTIKTKQPGLMLLLLNKNDLELFLRRSEEIGFFPSYFASKNAFDAVRTSKTVALYNGLCFTYPYEQLHGNMKFVDEYKAKFNEEPRIYADNTYDALFVLAKAKKLAQEKNIPFREALTQTEAKGVVGVYKYSTEKSFSLGVASLMCVSDGQPKVVS